MNQHSNSSTNLVFEYHTLRTLVGIIALLLPFACWWLATRSTAAPSIPTSISITYHMDILSRVVFVGSLFIVGAFLFAYNGKTQIQMILATVAGVCALGVALFPTSCQSFLKDIFAVDGLKFVQTCFVAGAETTYQWPHMLSAIVLFVILAVFCWIFYDSAKDKGVVGGRRKIVYLACLVVMVISMLVGIIIMFIHGNEYQGNGVFWVELSSLVAFGVSWLTAGQQIIPGLKE